VVGAIVGSELAASETFVAPAIDRTGPPVLEVRDMRVPGKLEQVSFDVRPGEVVGIAGLAGSGRTVLLKTLFGEIRPVAGVVTVAGAGYRPDSPAAAIDRGVYLIPEDRRVHGAVLAHTVEENIVLSILRRMSPGRLYRPALARRETRSRIEALGIRTTGPRQLVGELSGGNQQKVVLSKALAAGPRLFLLDEPTFGVDVHTAAEIIRHMREEVAGGKGVIWVSSDLSELLAVSDRVYVLADGAIKSEIKRGAPDFTEDALLRAIQRSGTSAALGPAA
jgi:ribose transport system ATP-binding protein